jgi:hypothetical protein
MAIRMVSLKSSKNGEWIARKGIPADVRADYKRLYGVAHEAILRVPSSTSKAQAKACLGEWQAEVETQIERIRAAAKGTGQPLTVRNAMALSGRWYEWFLARHDDDPGSVEHWADRKEHLTERVWYPHAPLEHLEDPYPDRAWPWTQWPEVREAVRPEVAEMALVATFLASEGMALTTDASILFIDAVSQRLFTAYAVLEQRANGDYSRDACMRTPWSPSLSPGVQEPLTGRDGPSASGRGTLLGMRIEPSTPLADEGPGYVFGRRIRTRGPFEFLYSRREGTRE